MNNQIKPPRPRHDPFIPEEGWHFYRHDGLTLVPYEQVNKVLTAITQTMAQQTRTDYDKRT